MARRKSNATSMPEVDKRWQEESDARTLAEAAAIRKDPSRFAGAKSGAKRMVEEESARLAGLRGVARSAPKKAVKKKR